MTGGFVLTFDLLLLTCFRADNMRDKKKKRLDRCQRWGMSVRTKSLKSTLNVFRFTLEYNPFLAMTFVAVYWTIGLFHAYSV